MPGHLLLKKDRGEVEANHHLYDSERGQSFWHHAAPDCRISKQMLTKQLRELEADGILERTIYAEIPPRVEYSITAYGESLMPIIDAMSVWGLAEMGQEEEN